MPSMWCMYSDKPGCLVPDLPLRFQINIHCSHGYVSNLQHTLAHVANNHHHASQSMFTGLQTIFAGQSFSLSLSARSSRRLRPHRNMGKPRVTTSDKNSGRLALRQANHAGSWLQSAMTLGQIYLKQIYASSHPILWVDDPYYDMVSSKLNCQACCGSHCKIV